VKLIALELARYKMSVLVQMAADEKMSICGKTLTCETVIDPICCKYCTRKSREML
jgi:hypothetical protein